jgi:hypothetical protein
MGEESPLHFCLENLVFIHTPLMQYVAIKGYETCPKVILQYLPNIISGCVCKAIVIVGIGVGDLFPVRPSSCDTEVR